MRISIPRNDYLVQYTTQAGYCHSVVRHRNMLRTGMGYTIEHIFPVEHAGAAMDNQIISGQVYGKVIPGDEVYLQLPPMRFRSRRGILTVPMSSVSGAWVQASAISTRDWGVKLWIAAAPPRRH